MVFNFKHSGKLTAGVSMTDRVINWFKSLKSNLKGGSNLYETPRVHVGGEGELNWEVSGSLEISAEEMVQLMKSCNESDKNTWDLLKKMGKDLITGAKEVRKVAKEEIPEWQKIISDAQITDVKNSRKFKEEYSKEDKE
jgi:hypothetical protein